MLFPPTVSCLFALNSYSYSQLYWLYDCKVCKRWIGITTAMTLKRRVSYHISPPYSSVLTSVALYHKNGGIPEKGSASKARTIWEQNKSTQRLPCKTARCLTDLFSVTRTPEVSISYYFASKMSLHEFGPAQTELYSLLLGQVSSANLAEG